MTRLSDTFEPPEPYQLIKARHGWILANRNDVYLGQAIVRYGECCELEVQVLKQLLVKPGRLVEVGANAGLLTLPLAVEMARRGGGVEAFEPQQFVFQNLAANMALNGLANVRVWPFACGSAPGYVDFAKPDYLVGGNFGGVMMETRPGAGSSSVPCVRLDDVLGPEAVGLVKIDVEGAELEVLKGMEATLSAHRPLMHIENDRVEKSKQLIEFLWANDYRLWWHISALFNGDNFFNNRENIYGDVSSFNMICVPREMAADIQGQPEISDVNAHPLRAAV